jgi:hypothetical protein
MCEAAKRSRYKIFHDASKFTYRCKRPHDTIFLSTNSTFIPNATHYNTKQKHTYMPSLSTCSTQIIMLNKENTQTLYNTAPSFTSEQTFLSFAKFCRVAI